MYTQEPKIDFWDYFLILKKHFKLYLILAIVLTSATYGLIYFFISEEFEATAVILPTDQSSELGLGSMLKGLSNLPIGLPKTQKEDDMALYNVIIYSRTMLNEMITKFDLLKEYNTDSYDKARKRLIENIKTEVVEDNAYQITVRSKGQKKCAEMANWIVDRLNQKSIALKAEKSRANRMFLETRYTDVMTRIIDSEKKMKEFQQKTGIVLPEEQLKVSIEALTKLDVETEIKKLEYSIAKQVLGDNNPNLEKFRITKEQFQSSLNNTKQFGNETKTILPFSNLPENATKYYELFREVKINNQLLEYLVPVYEQAKFEEQKNTPVIQIIDKAVAPEKRVYPKRLIMAGAISFSILLTVWVFQIFRVRLTVISNPKLKQLLNIE